MRRVSRPRTSGSPTDVPELDSAGSKLAASIIFGTLMFVILWLAAGLGVELAFGIGMVAGAAVGLILVIRT